MTLGQAIIYGLAADRPAFGIQGRIYICSDTGVWYYDTGSAWDNVTPGGSASPLTTKGDVYGFSTTDARIPVGSNGQVLTADSTEALGVKWAPGGGGGSGNVAYGTLASRPSSGSTGDMYVCSDVDYYCVWNGSTWSEYFGTTLVGIPPSTGWSWINQGSSVQTQNRGQIQITWDPSGGDVIRSYLRTIPGSTYTIIAGFRQQLCGAGISLYNSSSQYGLTFFWGTDSVLHSYYYGPGSYSYAGAEFSNVTVGGANPQLTWMKIVEDGVHRTYYISLDRARWIQIGQVSSNNLFTPSHCGIGVDSSGSPISGVSCFDYTPTTP